MQSIQAGITNLVLGPVSGIASGSFSIPSSGTTTDGFYEVSLAAVDAKGRAATNSITLYPAVTSDPASWASYYRFTGGAADVDGLFSGKLNDGASIVSDPLRARVLSLQSASSQYVSLPSGVGPAQTISGWIKWNGGGAWQRIFDFGQNDNDFFFLTSSDAANRLQCAITPDLAVYNQVIESPAPLPINQWTHVAVVMDGHEGILYVNGKAVAVNNSVNLLPSDIVATNCSFGKSQFSADPCFNGFMSSMRLNSQALSPPQLFSPISLMVQPLHGAVQLVWPQWAAPLRLYSSDDLNGTVWLPVTNTPTASGGLLSVVLLDSNAPRFFRLAQP